MKILLTGAAGKLGEAVFRLASDEHEVVGIDLHDGGNSAIHTLSFTERDKVSSLMEGCDVVIHTAALHGGHAKTHSPTQYVEINVGGLATLLDLCLEHGVKRMVYSSSMEVVVGKDWLANGLGVFDESTPPAPDWIYPLTKLQGELMGKLYQRRHGLEFVALRYMNIRDNKPCMQLLTRGNVRDDVARANLLAASVPGIGFEVFHIGPETPLRAADMVQAQSDPRAVLEQYWPGSSDILGTAGVQPAWKYFWPVTRIDKARRLLGWKPEVTFQTYLDHLSGSAGGG